MSGLDKHQESQMLEGKEVKLKEAQQMSNGVLNSSSNFFQPQRVSPFLVPSRFSSENGERPREEDGKESFSDSKKMERVKRTYTVQVADVKSLKKLSLEGHLDAQLQLGWAYLAGVGTPQNLQEARYWLEALAVRQGTLPVGLTARGLCYLEGLSVEKETKKAFECFQEAARYEYAPAQYHLGLCYQHEVNVEEDEEEAVRLYHLSAWQHYAPAQYSLGVCYDNGMGLAKNEARKYFKRASQEGEESTQQDVASFISSSSTLGSSMKFEP